MKPTSLAVAVLLALAGTVRVGAIELSLEENKAERGNIGFVDTQRLFKLFPETAKAKENFEETVRQAEDQINLRKAEILRLRKEIDELKVERLAVAKSTPTVAVPIATVPAAAIAPAVPASTSTAAAPFKSAIASPQFISQLPGFGPTGHAVSSATAAQPLIINLPGATTGPIVIAPPAGSGAPAMPAPKLPFAAPAISTAAARAAPSVPPAVSTAAASGELDAALAVLDLKLAQKTRELERKQAQVRDEQDAAEKNLLDLESRRTEILMGKIYKAVQEVARREGVSVVVDKTGILYGHNAVDLTEKVLKYLKGG
jgi:Skp family chaperone for outer membrane proteins